MSSKRSTTATKAAMMTVTTARSYQGKHLTSEVVTL
jgi:hypothetical protein